MRGAAFLGAVMAMTLAAAPVTAGDAQAAPAISDAEQQRLDATAAIGRLLFDYDRSAWVATDAMLAAVPRESLPQRGSWVVVPRADGALVVTFYAIRDKRGFGYFTAVTRDGRVIEQRVIPAAESSPLPAIEQRMADAWMVAMGDSRHQPCAPARFNFVILPPASLDAPVSVYLLTPQVRHNEYPMGGHFRVDVDKDGRIAVDRAFTNSCLTMSVGGDEKRGAPVAVGITHLLDPVPTEVHVFLSLSMRKPVAVGTKDGRIWMVEGDRIRLISAGKVGASE